MSLVDLPEKGLVTVTLGIHHVTQGDVEKEKKVGVEAHLLMIGEGGVQGEERISVDDLGGNSFNLYIMMFLISLNAIGF